MLFSNDHESIKTKKWYSRLIFRCSFHQWLLVRHALRAERVFRTLVKQRTMALQSQLDAQQAEIQKGERGGGASPSGRLQFGIRQEFEDSFGHGGAPPPHFCSGRFRFQRLLADSVPS